MWTWIDKTINEFRSCFSRRATFCCFALVLIGLMVRNDHLGISSIVRELSLTANNYESLNHFFRSTAWFIGDFRDIWLKIVKINPFLIKEDGRYILIGDGVQASKEGRKMPGVKKLHQQSDNSSKGEYIHGHLYGGLGILMGNAEKIYSVLLSARLHDGIAAIMKWTEWTGEEYNNEDSHVVKMIHDAGRAIKTFGDSLLLLDRLFLTRPMLMALVEYPGLSVVTKAKSNATAYFYPGKYKGIGARAKKGAEVKVASFFTTHAPFFSSATMNLYGKDETVKYFCIDLLWGKKLYQPLRFVLTVMDGEQSILVSTDLTLAPKQIIRLYCRRFKIECSFRELKQVVAGFSYHFWSKAMSKLQKFKSNKVNEANLEKITDPHERELIVSTVKAIEGYVQISTIALGMLQMISLHFGNEINNSGKRYLRTVSNTIPSERTVADFLRTSIYMLFRFFPDLVITSIIKERQLTPNEPDSEEAA